MPCDELLHNKLERQQPNGSGIKVALCSSIKLESCRFGVLAVLRIIVT